MMKIFLTSFILLLVIVSCQSRDCQLISTGETCYDKCCGNPIYCLETCKGISCSSHYECDGECCRQGTCGPCQCSSDNECDDECCSEGKCQRCETKGWIVAVVVGVIVIISIITSVYYCYWRRNRRQTSRNPHMTTTQVAYTNYGNGAYVIQGGAQLGNQNNYPLTTGNPPGTQPPQYTSQNNYPPITQSPPGTQPPQYTSQNNYPPTAQSPPGTQPPQYTSQNNYPPITQSPPTQLPQYTSQNNYPPTTQSPPTQPPQYNDDDVTNVEGTNQFPQVEINK